MFHSSCLAGRLSCSCVVSAVHTSSVRARPAYVCVFYLKLDMHNQMQNTSDDTRLWLIQIQIQIPIAQKAKVAIYGIPETT